MNNCIPASAYCKKIFDGTHDTPKPVLSGFPLITSKNILGGILNLKDSYNISEVNYTDIQKRSKVSQWDILFSMIGSVGEIYLEKSPNIPYAIKNVGVFSCNDEYKAKWLYYYFKSPLAKQYIQNYLNGAVQKFLPLGTLRSFPVLPYDDKYISSIDLLFALDSKIELNNCINAELEAMAKTIYDYWFVQFDFPDKNGKPYKTSGGKMVWNGELKREIPEGWEVKELQEIAKCLMGQSPKGESYNQDGIGSPLLNGPADYENGALKGRTYTTEPTRLCRKDDLVLCIRATIGNLVYSEQEFCLGRGVAAVRANDKKLSELIYFLLIQEIERFKVQATGSIIVGITKDDLIESKCLLPSVELINSFHNLIKPQFDKIRVNLKENQKLTELRDWLLPMLMNGQVRVEDEKETELSMAAEAKMKYGK
jgi:type I restriction enzyme, S subunit